MKNETTLYYFGATSTLDNLSILHLPVGVKSLEELNDTPSFSNTSQLETKLEDEVKAQPLATSWMPRDEFIGAGFEPYGTKEKICRHS